MNLIKPGLYTNNITRQSIQSIPVTAKGLIYIFIVSHFGNISPKKKNIFKKNQYNNSTVSQNIIPVNVKNKNHLADTKISLNIENNFKNYYSAYHMRVEIKTTFVDRTMKGYSVTDN